MKIKYILFKQSISYIILFFSLFVTLLTNDSYANNLSDKYNEDKLLNDKIASLTKKILNHSDLLIFNHALNPDTLDWFSKKFFIDIKNEEKFKYEIERYLLSSESLKKFIFLASHEIEENINEIYNNKLKIHINSDVTNKFKKSFEESIPTVDDMISSIYKDLEIKGLTTKEQSMINDLYNEYRTKYPKTTIGIQNFTKLLFSFLPFFKNGPGYVKIIGSGGGFVICFIDSLDKNYTEGINELYIALRNSIFNVRENFHKKIEKFIEFTFNSINNDLNKIIP